MSVINLNNADSIYFGSRKADRIYAGAQQVWPYVWDPASLFANGEQGAIYCPTSDFAGLYQDAIGTTPVTAAGQPVGLMLDRRFGLARGPRMEANGDFSSNVEGWSVFNAGSITVTWVSPGYLRSTGAAGGPYQDVPVTAGAWVEVVVRLRVAAVGLRLRAFQGGGFSTELYSKQVSATSGFEDFRFLSRSPTSSLRIYLNGFVGHDFEADSVSVRELPGNHASQPTTTARPTLRSSPLRIDYDGVDDYLRTVFPDLGDDVTIARSIPGVGAQILTGQTIAAGNWDDNVDSCATLVIDRALTGPETALVTAFLNQQAGV